MSFDVAGARQAGYSDKDIAEYLAPRRNFNIAGAREAGYSDADIVSYLMGRPAPSEATTLAPTQQTEALTARPPTPERGFLGSIASAVGDTGASLVTGAGSALSGIGGLGGVAGLGYDNLLSRAGRRVSEFGEGLMSPELVEKRQALSRAIQDAESQGLIGEARAALSTLASNPSLLFSMAIEQIPAFVLSGGVGRGASAVGQVAARRAGAVGAEAIEQAGQRAGQVAAVGTAAGLQGGSVAEETYQDVMRLPAETLQSSPAYQELIRSMSPAEARATLADRAAREAGILGGGISVGTMALMPSSAERALFSRGVSQSAIRRALGVGTAEAGSEAIEEGGGQFAQNLAVQRRAELERSLTQGVGGAAATGAVLGGIMGAGVGAIQRPPTPPSTEPGAGNLPEGLRGAIEDYVASREPMTAGQNLLPRELPVVETPVGNLTVSQAIRYFERRFPELASVDDVQEKIRVGLSLIAPEQEARAAGRQEEEVGRYRREVATSPETAEDFRLAELQRVGRKLPASPAVIQRDLAEAERQLGRFMSDRDDAASRLNAIESAPTLNIPAREAVRAEIAQLDQLIADGESARRKLANALTVTEQGGVVSRVGPSLTAQENIGAEAGRAFGQREIQERLGRRPVSEQEMLRDLTRAEEQIQAFGKARDDAAKRLRKIEKAKVVDAPAREAVQAEIELLDQLIAAREAERRSIANAMPETQRDITARENLRAQAGEAFDIAEARRERREDIALSPGVDVPTGTVLTQPLDPNRVSVPELATREIDQPVDDTRAGAAPLTEMRYVLNPKYKKGRLVDGEAVTQILPSQNPGKVLAYVERRQGAVTREVPIETTMDKLAQVPIRGTARATQEARAAGVAPPRGVGSDIQPRRAVDRQTPEASARSTEAAQAEAEAAPTASEADVRAERRIAALNRINALYLDKLKGMGVQGRLIRNALVDALKNRTMSAEEVYAAFTAADKFADLLPAGANHRIEFVKELLPTKELAEAIARSGGNPNQTLQGLRLRPKDEGLLGVIKISLAPDALPILGETVAHEAFHVLQDYYGKHDAQFKKLMDQGFRDKMKITDVDPTIRRKLEQARYPNSTKSYWDVLTDAVKGPVTAREAQAYAFGALVDASRRGVPMSGLKPAFARFVNTIKNFFSKLGSALRGDGFQTAEELLGRVAREGGRRFAGMATPTARDVATPGPELSARGAPRFIRSARQLLDDAKETSSWRDWYERHEGQVKDLFGDDAPLFQQILSATSQAASVPANVSLALKAYEQLLTDKPFTGYLPAVIKNLERIKAEEELRGQKISQYGKANKGDAEAAGGVAVDRHIAQLMFGTDRPTKQMVQKATKAIQSIGRILGWQPREVQAALWAFNQIRRGVDPANVKSYDFYLSRKQEDIRALRAAFTRGEGEGVRVGEAASGRTGEADAGGQEGLTEEQFEASARATNTTVPEFKKWWMGGWRGEGVRAGPSYVVEPDGSPMLVYHGTQRGFTRFGEARSGSYGQEGPYFFSPDPGFAEEYALSQMYAGGRGEEATEGQRMLPVYLSMQKPFDPSSSARRAELLQYVERGLYSGDLDWRDIVSNSSSKATYERDIARGRSAADVTRNALFVFRATLSSASDNWPALEARATQRFLRENGFDGFYVTELGTKNIAVYDPRQIKSVFNRFEAGAALEPEFSARSPLAADPAFAALRDKLTGKEYDKPNVFADALRRFTGALPGEKNSAALVRTSVNRASPIWIMDRLAKEQGLSLKSAAIALEVALNNSGRVQMYLDHGPLAYDPKTGDVTVREDTPGLIAAIKGRLRVEDKKEAQTYLVALRERDLRKAGKKGFFNLTDAEIKQIISKSEAAHPEWKQMAADIQRINKALLDFAVATGTLDQTKADQLASMFYTPFYRQAEEDAQDNADAVIGPRMSDNLTSIKTVFDVSLKGGENPLGDLFENMIRNADAIMKAGMKNVAMAQSAEVMQAAKMGREVKKREAGKTITFRVNGKDKHFEVDEPVFYAALAGAPRHVTNGIYQTMANVAGFFRDMITIAPSFMLANLWRGKIMAYVQEGVPFYTNTFDGLRQALKSSASYKAIAAQTGFGGYTYGMGERDATEAFEREIAGVGYGPKGMLRRAYDALQKASEATEMAERIKLYERMKAQGMTDKEAAFQAYQLAPFSRRGMGGGWVGSTVQWLIPLVPFLNAKIQGMYRLIENEKGDTQKLWTLGIPKQMFLRGLVVTAASLALAAKNMADEPERWDNENPDLKFKYDIWYLPGGNRILLPRAFEVGSVFGALPVFLLDAYRRQDGRDLGKVLTDIGTSTFFFNPIPQAAIPLIGAATNYDFFRGRALETAGDRTKLPEERFNRSTSEIAKFLGQQTGLSPIRIQYVLEGYSGTIGANMLAGFDSILASIGAIPGKPAGAFGDPLSMPAIIAGLTGASRFYRSDDQSASRFVGDFYKIKEMTDQLVRSQTMAMESRNLDRLAELRGEEGLPLRLRPMVNQASTQISEINRRMERIERSDLDSVSKTDALRPLREQRDRIAQRVVERARQMGAY